MAGEGIKKGRLVARASFRGDSPPPPSPQLPRSPRSRLVPPHIKKLSDCTHFHFATVELGPISISVVDEESGIWRLRVESDNDSWEISRTWLELADFDRQLHRCIFERRHSKLAELELLESELSSSSGDSTGEGGSDQATGHSGSTTPSRIRHALEAYLSRLSRLTGSLINCYPVLKFLEVDSRGRHFSPAEMSAINTTAIASAIVTQDFVATQHEHLTIRVGDIISIIEMCSRQQSKDTFWKAKLTIPASRSMDHDSDNAFKIGYFPSDCVQLLADKSSPRLGAVDSSSNGHKFAHLAAARRLSEMLKKHGVVRRRNPVFSVDLESHLAKSGRAIPQILEKCVTAIEEYGIVTGIYRQCGIQSNIQRLRAKFDSGCEPDLAEFAIVRDIYCVSSLLKQYFRQLPNPLFTYQLYPRLLDAYNSASNDEQIRNLKSVLDDLPESHYNTARFLMRHLSRLCHFTALTDMTSRNLAIVWAPNLFRAPPTATGHDSHLLNGLNVHTSLCNIFIEHADDIFGAEEEEDGMRPNPLSAVLTPSPSLPSRHQSFNECIIDDNSSKKSNDFRWSRVFRGKSVDGLIGNFTVRRRTVNGDRARRRSPVKEESPEQKVKWRRSRSTDAAFRNARSESIISMMARGYGEIRDGVRSWTKRAYSMRPGSRPPASPRLFRNTHERMQESITVSTISRVSTSEKLDGRKEIIDESPTTSCSGSFVIERPGRERKVVFRVTKRDRESSSCEPQKERRASEERNGNDVDEEVALAERFSPVEEWSSDSRNSIHLEVSRYDNVSPARPRDHIVDQEIVNGRLHCLIESYDNNDGGVEQQKQLF